MRSRTLVTVFAAAGTIADTNIQVAPERKQPTEPSIGRWTAPNLSARPNSAFQTPSARRADFQIARRDSWRRGSRRTRISRRQDDGDDTGDEEEDNTGDEEDEDEDDDGDDDDGDDDDTDDEDDEENSKKKSNAGAIAGGVIGGLVFIVLLFLLLFWFWLRPRRMRRRRRRREEDEEEKRRRQKQEHQQQQEDLHHNNPNNDSIISYPQQQQQQQQQQPQAYQPIPTGPEPISGRGGVFAPFGGAINTKDAKTGSTSPPLPPQGTAASPAELASPVDADAMVADGREPAPAQPDYGNNNKNNKLRLASPSSPPPRYSTAFPSMELPSPVGSINAVADGREPSSLGSTLDYGYGYGYDTKASGNFVVNSSRSNNTNNNNNRVQPGHVHPADQPNPDY